MKYIYSESPTTFPSPSPSQSLSLFPTLIPSGAPTSYPSANSSGAPSSSPSDNPSAPPSAYPTTLPSSNPTGLFSQIYLCSIVDLLEWKVPIWWICDRLSISESNTGAVCLPHQRSISSTNKGSYGDSDSRSFLLSIKCAE